MKLFNKLFRNTFNFVLFTGILGSMPVYAQTKIVFVNTERILKESVPAQEAQKSLNKDFSKRESDLLDLAKKLKTKSDQLERDSNILSHSEKLRLQSELTDNDAVFQRERRNLEEEIQARRNQLLSNVLDRANREVIRIAESENIEVVLQDAVWINPKIDITDKVLDGLKKK